MKRFSKEASGRPAAVTGWALLLAAAACSSSSGSVSPGADAGGPPSTDDSGDQSAVDASTSKRDAGRPPVRGSSDAECDHCPNPGVDGGASSASDARSDSGSTAPGDAGSDATAPVSTALARAQAFAADLSLGVWIPRGQQTVLTYSGTLLYKSPQFFAYLAGLGDTHVALSYPWTPLGSSGGDLSFVSSPSVTDSYFSAQLAAAKLANAAGLKVVHRLADNVQVPGDFGATLDSWLTTAGKAIATSGLDPSMNVFVPWGEMNGSTNAVCNPLTTSGDQTLRAVLPQSGGWLLGVSGAYWESVTVLNSDSSGVGRAQVTLASGGIDEQVVYVFDGYPVYKEGLESQTAGFEASAAQWQEAHGGAPLLELELGDWLGQTQYDTDPGNPGAWASSFMPLAEGVGQYAPIFWDLSNSDASLNMATLDNGTEATLSSANASGLKAACAFVQSQSYQGKGSLR